MKEQFGSDQRRPFLAAPNPQRYFAAGAIEEARQRIVRAIARREGPALLIGAAGTGKSLLLAVLAEEFAPRVAVVTLAGAQLCTRRALLQMILCDLGLPYREMDEGELRLAILLYLRGAETAAANTMGAGGGGAKPRAAGAAPRRLLLLVDEADSLPVRLLEELRVLSNVAAEGLPLVSLVLAGGPMLEERFADPQLDAFSQRIAARTYLAPLGRGETFQYVRSQVAAAGMKPDELFAPDALEAIHSATGGVPRLINQLGDQLAWMAEETGCAPLDGALVQQAWSDLQQLPAPWNTEGSAPASAIAGMVEFGELDGGSDADADGSDAAHDDMPASIPIAAARGGAAAREAQLDPSVDATEQLLELRDDHALHGIIAAKPASRGASANAFDPFAELFDEEEVLLDPYAVLKAELLRKAPQVINRLDRAFAADLDRCLLERVAPPARGAAESSSRPAAAVKSDAVLSPSTLSASLSKIRLHDLPSDRRDAIESYGDVLVIDDDDRPSAALIAGRQFRRLFSCLESSGTRSLLG